MANNKHSDQTVSDGIHIIHAFEYLTANLRASASVSSTDIGKIARQTDNNTFYVLLDDSPVTWMKLTGSLSFLELDETPSSYSGTSQYFVKVNSGETGLEFVANITASIISGSTFYGDGSNLTGISGNANPVGDEGSLQYKNGGAFGGSSGLTWASSRLGITGSLTASQVVSASAFYGDGSGLTNVTSVTAPAGNDQSIQFNNEDVTGGSDNLAWDGTNLNITGNITASGIVTASAFYGDGSNLINVTPLMLDITKISFFDHFNGEALIRVWDNAADDGGYNGTVSGTGGHLKLKSGTDSGSAAILSFNTVDTILMSCNPKIYMRGKVKEETDTSGSVIKIGVFDGDSSDSAFFIFNGSGNWQTVTTDGASIETNDSGETLSNDTWQKFEISGSSAEIKFYIDNSLVATHNTQIPGERMEPYVTVETQTASFTKNYYLDYYGFVMDEEL